LSVIDEVRGLLHEFVLTAEVSSGFWFLQGHRKWFEAGGDSALDRARHRPDGHSRQEKMPSSSSIRETFDESQELGTTHRLAHLLGSVPSY
jgi:hypothetical protein